MQEQPLAPSRKTAIPAARRKRLSRLRPILDNLYQRYNRRAYVDPDPLAPLYRYPDPRDQEIVGLITASLAFGNVKQILKSIDIVLEAFPRPADTLQDLPLSVLRKRLDGFRHRYTTGEEMAALLAGAAEALRSHGSLAACFHHHRGPGDETVIPGLTRFTAYLRGHGDLPKNYLLPDPALGSACKRWFMFLRWMVRKDDVDLGIWTQLNPSQLIIPVDTHMHRVAQGLGLTRRKNADLKTALEITEAFGVICPEDPVRYDFCLTRLGIRDDGDMDAFLLEARKQTRPQ